jgi:N-acetylneuraminic acid mutarotase
MAYFGINGYLYLLGGDLGANCTNELWRYSIASDNWDQRLAFSGGPAKWQFGIRYGRGALVYGGWNGSGTETKGIYEYIERDNVWVHYAGPADSAIVSRTIGYSHNSTVYFIGGRCSDTIRHDVWAFDYPDKTWYRATDFPVKQKGGVAVEINNVAYVGFGSDENDVCNETLWFSTDRAQTWNMETNYPITGSVLGGVVCNNRLYMIDESHYLLEYNPITNGWTKKSQLPANRHAFQCIFSEADKIYIGLGVQGVNSLIVYDPIWDNVLP